MTLNWKQKLLLMIGVGGFTTMGCFPPALKIDHTYSRRSGRPVFEHDGYSFILDRFDRVDFDRLFLQWGVLVVAIGSSFFFVAGRKPRKPQNSVRQTREVADEEQQEPEQEPEPEEQQEGQPEQAAETEQHVDRGSRVGSFLVGTYVFILVAAILLLIAEIAGRG